MPFIVNVEFSGGIELLFNKQKELSIELPPNEFSSGKTTIKDLLPFLRDHYLQERQELFMSEDTVRPGILVLINHADWEIDHGLDSVLYHNDTVTFISTLHGG